MRRSTAVLTLAAAASTVALGLAVPARAATPSMVRLTSAADNLSSYKDLGALPAATKIQLAVSLTDPWVAAEDRLLAAQAAGTANYTTPAEWDAAFAIPQATYQIARTFATAHGLQVVDENGTHSYLLLAGTAAEVEKTFSVSLDRYTVPGLTKTYYASPDLPLVPAAAGIEGVIGLDNMRGANLSGLKKSNAAVSLTPGPTTPADDVCAPLPVLSRAECSFFIDDFTKAYDLPATYTGQGQKIGIFGEGDYKTVESDLRKFEAQFKRPQIPVRVVNVHDDQSDGTGTDEWDLDTQSSSGIARGAAQLVLYFGEDLTDASINMTYNAWADDPNGPHQMNASFGECAPIAGGLATPVVTVPVVGGFGLGTQSIAAYDAQEAALRQARAEGRTLFASAGDQGGSCGIGIPNAFENNAVPEVNVPAGSPNAVGVGGTDLETDGTTGARVAELGANAGGGGSSLSIPADRTYAAGVTVNPLVATEDFQLNGDLPPCVTTQEGARLSNGPLCRSVPDVAALCGNLFIEGGYAGLNIYTGGMIQPVAGTSLASPLTMGMWARIQSSDTNPAGYGFANLSFYKLGKEQQAGQKTVSDTTTTVTISPTTSASPSTSSSTSSGTAANATSSTTGTSSASSQATAGILPLGDAERAALQGRTSRTFLAPFYDVTTDFVIVGVPTQGNTQHTAEPGYDQSTGWGVLDVAHFINDLPRTTTQVFAAVPPSSTGKTGTSGSTSSGSGSLAFTGLEAGVPLAAISLITAGTATLVLSRRRRRNL